MPPVSYGGIYVYLQKGECENMKKRMILIMAVLMSIFVISCGSETKEALDKSEIAEVVESKL